MLPPPPPAPSLPACARCTEPHPHLPSLPAVRVRAAPTPRLLRSQHPACQGRARSRLPPPPPTPQTHTHTLPSSRTTLWRGRRASLISPERWGNWLTCSSRRACVCVCVFGGGGGEVCGGRQPSTRLLLTRPASHSPAAHPPTLPLPTHPSNRRSWPRRPTFSLRMRTVWTRRGRQKCPLPTMRVRPHHLLTTLRSRSHHPALPSHHPDTPPRPSHPPCRCSGRTLPLLCLHS